MVVGRDPGPPAGDRGCVRPARFARGGGELYKVPGALKLTRNSKVLRTLLLRPSPMGTALWTAALRPHRRTPSLAWASGLPRGEESRRWPTRENAQNAATCISLGPGRPWHTHSEGHCERDRPIHRALQLKPGSAMCVGSSLHHGWRRRQQSRTGRRRRTQPDETSVVFHRSRASSRRSTAVEASSGRSAACSHASSEGMDLVAQIAKLAEPRGACAPANRRV